MPRLRLAPVALALVLLLHAAGAAHDDGCEPERHPVKLDTGVGSPLSAAQLRGGEGDGRYYVARDPPPCPGIIELCVIGPHPVAIGTYWIYEESNGVEGLQRDDEVWRSDACGHPGDTVIF